MCPVHKGVWSGIEWSNNPCPHKCQLTGWIQEEADQGKPLPGVQAVKLVPTGDDKVKIIRDVDGTELGKAKMMEPNPTVTKFTTMKELADFCESWNVFDYDGFKRIVSSYLSLSGILPQALAAEFDVAPTQISGWASGLMIPREGDRSYVVGWIAKRSMNDLDLTGTFGMSEMESAARCILRKCTQHKSWDCHFTLKDFSSEDEQTGFLNLLANGYMDCHPFAHNNFLVDQSFIQRIESKYGVLPLTRA
jgi:hypothetical protein